MFYEIAGLQTPTRKITQWFCAFESSQKEQCQDQKGSWSDHLSCWGWGIPYAQTGSALTRAGRSLGEMGTVQVFSLLASFFFVGFREQSIISVISQLHPWLYGFQWSWDSTIYGRKLSFRNSVLKLWELCWMHSGPDWKKEGAPKKIPSLVLMVFLWIFLPTGEIRGNWGEGNALTPQHLNILDVTLGNHRPISAPPKSWALRDRNSFVKVTLSLWQSWHRS